MKCQSLAGQLVRYWTTAWLMTEDRSKERCGDWRHTVGILLEKHECLSKYHVLRALVSSVVSCSTQVQCLAACGSAAFPCCRGCGFCCLCDLDALRRDSFFFIFELKGFLPTISRCSVLLIVTMATRRRMDDKQHSGDFAIDYLL